MDRDIMREDLKVISTDPQERIREVANRIRFTRLEFKNFSLEEASHRIVDLIRRECKEYGIDDCDLDYTQIVDTLCAQSPQMNNLFGQAFENLYYRVIDLLMNEES